MTGIDLHLHSSASDGDYSPADVARRAGVAGLRTIALTDHDTLAGVEEARRSGQSVGVEVIAGCEFSVAVSWGEMHLLGYFLPVGEAKLEGFLQQQRRHRITRGGEIVRRLGSLGVALTEADVRRAAGGGAIGRPHVAKALVERHFVRDISEAFDRYLSSGRPAYVPKRLPEIKDVVDLVRGLGGVTSAAHLRERADPQSLEELKRLGVDAVEVLHPGHDARARRRIDDHARHSGLLRTGGSDWHGESRIDDSRGALGAVQVPEAWLQEIEALHEARVAQSEVVP